MDMKREWPEPGWEGHRKQQARDIVRYTTPEQRLEWLEEAILLFKFPLKEDYWTPDGSVKRGKTAKEDPKIG